MILLPLIYTSDASGRNFSFKVMVFSLEKLLLSSTKRDLAPFDRNYMTLTEHVTSLDLFKIDGRLLPMLRLRKRWRRGRREV